MARQTVNIAISKKVWMRLSKTIHKLDWKMIHGADVAITMFCDKCDKMENDTQPVPKRSDEI